MSRHKIDLLKKKYELDAPKKSPFVFFGKPLLIAIVLLATTGMIFSYRVSSTEEISPAPQESGSIFSTSCELA